MSSQCGYYVVAAVIWNDQEHNIVDKENFKRAAL